MMNAVQMLKFEVVTTYYDRKVRKEVRHVHGVVEAESIDAAASEGRKLYGVDACKLLAERPTEFWINRAIKVKQV